MTPVTQGRPLSPRVASVPRPFGSNEPRCTSSSRQLHDNLHNNYAELTRRLQNVSRCVLPMCTAMAVHEHVRACVCACVVSLWAESGERRCGRACVKSSLPSNGVLCHAGQQKQVLNKTPLSNVPEKPLTAHRPLIDRSLTAH